MSDAPLRDFNGRHEWFWEPRDEAHIFPLENLMHMYENSVGHNSTLILGITPDYRGLVPEVDAQRMKEFGKEIKRRYGHPLAKTHGMDEEFILKFKEPTSVQSVVMSEDIRLGERVRIYRLEGKVNGIWQELASGSCIGHKRIEVFKSVVVSALRLSIDKSVGDPIISDFSAYTNFK